jgi:hypothetical protein
MLIKKNLKTELFVPCSIILKLKKQPFPIYPACKKPNNYGTPNFRLPSSRSTISSKIKQPFLESLPHRLNTKRQAQKEKKILRFLYPINFFNFQRKSKASRPPEIHPQIFKKDKETDTKILTLINSKKENNIYIPFARPLESQLKIVLKSYSSQLKDIKSSVTTISKLVHYLDNYCGKQFKKFLTNSFYLASFGSNPSFLNRLIKIKNFDYSLAQGQRISSALSLVVNVNTNAASSLNLNVLAEQPLIELLVGLSTCKVAFTSGATSLIGNSEATIKGQKKYQSAFLLSTLQKTNYCNRYLFKSSAFLDNYGLIDKQMQKTLNSTQLFTVIRSPFVFKKTREQFIKQLLSYSVTIKLHSPIQKQLFIQCLSLLRLPVELEIHC